MANLPPATLERQAGLRVTCVERAVVLSARLASRFIHAGLAGSPVFDPETTACLSGRSAASARCSASISPSLSPRCSRTTSFDFKEIGTSILQLWMLIVVKPDQCLGHENYLAETMKRHGLAWVERVSIPAGARLDYHSNGTSSRAASRPCGGR